MKFPPAGSWKGQKDQGDGCQQGAVLDWTHIWKNLIASGDVSGLKALLFFKILADYLMLSTQLNINHLRCLKGLKWVIAVA